MRPAGVFMQNYVTREAGFVLTSHGAEGLRYRSARNRAQNDCSPLRLAALLLLHSSALERQHAPAARGDLGVVRHDHQRRPALACQSEEQV